ncbi:MAG: orotidine-5'-phosphate decarboxylase [Candidatus Ornithospirochaeta sp.]|nr:orotidine-5'-phosphate decarboxylase [Candidatus Ornithospirochaeta sp.]
MSYLDQLRESAKETGNIVCMGLDPVLAALPGEEKGTRERIADYFSELFKRMRLEGSVPAAFKPNIGYYSCLDRPRDGDFSGSLALADVMDLLENYFPGVPVILDSKRGDIAKSSLNYANEAFDSWNADAVTVSPYMGTDSVMPFAFEDKGIYILDRTSNPGGADLQNQNVIDSIDEKEIYPLYLSVAHRIAAWAKEHQGIGAVVGATNPAELEDIAVYFSTRNIPMLIPGVGSQGGSAGSVIQIMRKAGYPLELARINSSSGLTHPWKKGPAPETYLEDALSAIRKLLGEASL